MDLSFENVAPELVEDVSSRDVDRAINLLEVASETLVRLLASLADSGGDTVELVLNTLPPGSARVLRKANAVTEVDGVIELTGVGMVAVRLAGAAVQHADPKRHERRRRYDEVMEAVEQRLGMIDAGSRPDRGLVDDPSRLANQLRRNRRHHASSRSHDVGGGAPIPVADHTSSRESYRPSVV